MCGICGFYNLQHEPPKNYSLVAHQLHEILQSTSVRGRDSFGIYMRGKNKKVNLVQVGKYNWKMSDVLRELYEIKPFVVLANFRGEPSTEFVEKKEKIDIQPFEFMNYVVAHNGTISNDKEVLKLGVIEKTFANKKLIDSYAILESAMANSSFEEVKNQLKGSWAMSLLYPNNKLILARNYRELSIMKKDHTIFWASMPENLEVLKEFYLEGVGELKPYSYLHLDKNYFIEHSDTPPNRHKAIVVISGGLDSTTSATQACMENNEVTLMHLAYGCKAESKEIEAVTEISKYLKKQFPQVKIELEFVNTGLFKKLGGATLIDAHDKIAKGDEGVETHHEWVHARNLVMISIAGAYCDRYDIGSIYLGLNMEEGSAYPDNTVGFYEKLTEVLQVGTISRPIIRNPLANLMKHEIVALAKKIKAPIHLSWSCYHNGETHCGECGPCIMRQVAFKRNNIQEGA